MPKYYFDFCERECKMYSMNEKALHVLEYDKITEQLASYAGSDAARKLCRELLPMTDVQDIEEAQTETQDALARLFRKGSVSFGHVREVRGEIMRLDVGAALSAPELLGIAGLLENAGIVKRYGRREKEEDPVDSLTSFFDALEPLTPVAAEIRRCIPDENEIADDASPALRQIRRQIRILNDRIHNELTRIISSSAGRDYLQDSLVTTRDGRYCIPVKQEYRGQVQGIIHDQSSSGSTVFIEPASVVKLNNDIRQAEIQEQNEIARILADLSERLAPYRDALTADFEILRNLDFIFARARLAMEMNASRPVYNTEGIIELRRARHPLIPKKNVVPIDIRLGEDFDLLVITGPNTGGKTVTLKTTGLLTLMGQAGLHIPAADQSRLSVFEEVYADIGDEQSIEQSLSTFSSHMTNVVSFMDRADENSLVLFDELGAGTDPTEGAALAISILTSLHERGVRTIATTHYSELKIYALRTPSIENASCEFDVDTLSPTYRLLIGVPGKSNAFAISRKLGLSEEIIDLARNQLSEQAESFEDVITELEASRKKLEEERETAAREREEIDRLRAELKEKKKELTQKKSDLIRSSSEEARNILQNAKDYADRTIREFAKAKESGASIQELEEKRDRLRKKISNYSSNAAEPAAKKKKGSLKPSDIHVGDRVTVLSLGVTATVNTLPDAKGSLYVTAGIMRTKVQISDLELSDEPEISAPGFSKSSSGKLRVEKSTFASSEINLIGKTVDEACAELGKFLDDAYMAHLQEVRIVHGKGTGALRKGIHDYLKREKHVRSFRLGAFGEGDAGVTIALIK